MVQAAQAEEAAQVVLAQPIQVLAEAQTKIQQVEQVALELLS
jgi:hypothetical protein